MLNPSIPLLIAAVHCSLLAGTPAVLFNTTLAQRDLRITRVVAGLDGIYVCGDALLHPTTGSADSADAFLARLDEGGNVTWMRFFRGSRTEFAKGLAVDTQGSAYIVGSTDSSDFPTLNALLPNSPSAGQPSPWLSGFLAKVDKEGRLVYSTYLGGSNETVANDVTVDSSQRAIATGQTRARDFPTTPGSYKPAFPPSARTLLSLAFATQFSADGKTLVASTLLGGDETTCSGGGGCVEAAAQNSGLALRLDASGALCWPVPRRLPIFLQWQAHSHPMDSWPGSIHRCPIC
jgi:hypothetical protein